VLIVRPSVTLDLNTNARDLRAFNKFKTAKVCARAAQLGCVEARLSEQTVHTLGGSEPGQRRNFVGLRAPRQPVASVECIRGGMHQGTSALQGYVDH
jgi:hypothetical protein